MFSLSPHKTKTSIQSSSWSTGWNYVMFCILIEKWLQWWIQLSKSFSTDWLINYSANCFSSKVQGFKTELMRESRVHKNHVVWSKDLNSESTGDNIWLSLTVRHSEKPTTLLIRLSVQHDSCFWFGGDITASAQCPGYKSIHIQSVTSHNQYRTIQSQSSSYKLLHDACLQIQRWSQCCTQLYRLTNTEEQWTG